MPDPKPTPDPDYERFSRHCANLGRDQLIDLAFHWWRNAQRMKAAGKSAYEELCALVYGEDGRGGELDPNGDAYKLAMLMLDIAEPEA